MGKVRKYEKGNFQFTTSQGGRRLNDVICHGNNIFQFTTSQGGRRDHPDGRKEPDLSIHDLTRRSTILLVVIRSGRPFQFTTSQGGRRQIPTIIANICIHYSLFCINLSFLHYFIFNFRITFPLCGSHIRCESLDIFCPLHIRTKELSSQSHQNRVLFQYVPLCFYTYLLDYKTADCPLPYL